MATCAFVNGAHLQPSMYSIQMVMIENKTRCRLLKINQNVTANAWKK